MNRKTHLGGLTKFATGIAGFDQLTGGGLPARRTTLVLGGPGTGKTVFALQALVHGAQQGEPGIFVSFNESPRHLMENGTSLGWDLAALEKRALMFLDARLRPGVVRPGHFDLTGMLAGLRAVATDLRARRLVFDSIDVLLTLLDDHLAEVQEIFRLRDWLREHEFTGILTASLEGGDPRAARRQGFLQFGADCTLTLEHRRTLRGAARLLRVVKYRGSGFQENEYPFVIGHGGIELGRARRARAAAATKSALEPEIELAGQQLTARLRDLGQFLEARQAELGFLLEKKGQRAGKIGAGRANSPPKQTGRTGTKTPPTPGAALSDMA